jgi:hypothetical protein
MQVGITLSTYSDNAGSYVQFDSFMLDAAAEGTPLQVSVAGGSLTITWPDYPGAVLQSSPNIYPGNWQPVAATPTYATGLATVTLPLGSGNLFFRLSQTAP